MASIVIREIQEGFLKLVILVDPGPGPFSLLFTVLLLVFLISEVYQVLGSEAFDSMALCLLGILISESIFWDHLSK